MSEALRTESWLSRERVRLVTLALLIASVPGAGFLVATSDGLNDCFGRPLSTDYFSNVYAAGSYVLERDVAAPFDPHRQYVRAQAIFGPGWWRRSWCWPSSQCCAAPWRKPAGMRRRTRWRQNKIKLSCSAD